MSPDGSPYEGGPSFLKNREKSNQYSERNIIIVNGKHHASIKSPVTECVRMTTQSINFVQYNYSGSEESNIRFL